MSGVEAYRVAGCPRAIRSAWPEDGDRARTSGAPRGTLQRAQCFGNTPRRPSPLDHLALLAVGVSAPGSAHNERLQRSPARLAAPREAATGYPENTAGVAARPAL